MRHEYPAHSETCKAEWRRASFWLLAPASFVPYHRAAAPNRPTAADVSAPRPESVCDSHRTTADDALRLAKRTPPGSRLAARRLRPGADPTAARGGSAGRRRDASPARTGAATDAHCVQASHRNTRAEPTPRVVAVDRGEPGASEFTWPRTDHQRPSARARCLTAGRRRGHRRARQRLIEPRGYHRVRRWRGDSTRTDWRGGPREGREFRAVILGREPRGPHSGARRTRPTRRVPLAVHHHRCSPAPG